MGKEINVRELSRRMLGRRVRLQWEEPLVLEIAGLRTLVFPFGSFVVVNGDEEGVRRVSRALRPFVVRPYEMEVEEYELIEAEDEREFRRLVKKMGVEPRYDSTVAVSEEACVVLKPFSPNAMKVVAFTLAQSLALSRVEREVDDALERARVLLERFERGGPFFNVRLAMKELVKVLKTRIEVISDIMIMDKPELTWEVPELDVLYEELRRLYELDERFAAVDKALEDIQELGSIISDLTLAYRESFLELMIILLIVLETLLSLIHLAL